MNSFIAAARVRAGRWAHGLIVLALLGIAWRAHALDVGATPPEIGLRALDGNAISLSALRGKVVIVDFWASWCAPCKEEMPVLERLHKKFGPKGLVIVGVSVDADLAKAKSFIVGLNVSFPIVHDAKHAVADRYAPPKMPTSIVIGRDGKIRFVHAGFRKEDGSKLEHEIAELLR